MTKHKQGTVSELIASSYFIQNNYIVSKPINDFGEYDLIVDNGKLNRVQVKTAYWDNSKKRYLISLVTSHIKRNGGSKNKKYTKNSFDILCAVQKETNTIYIIPIDKVIGRRSITVYPNGKPETVSIRNKDFEQYKVIQ
jgi:hypothetical protein